MDIEVELSPVVTADELVNLARIADEAGVSRLGISDVALFRDSFQLQVLCAAATERVRIGSLVTNPYVRHPAVVTAALGTLNEASNGRAFLGIRSRRGTILSGHRPRKSGPQAGRVPEGRRGPSCRRPGDIHWSNPSLAGRQAPTGYRREGAGGHRHPQPMVSRLAGRMADAVVVGARELAEEPLLRYARWVREGAAQASRNPDEVDIAPRVTLCISHDGDRARRSVVLYSAHYLSLGGQEQSKLPAAEFQRISGLASRASGWYFEHDVSYPPELDDIVGPEVIDRFAVAGTPAQCLPRLRALAGMGFRSVSMNIAAVRRPGVPMFQGLRETLEGLSEIVPRIHAL